MPFCLSGFVVWFGEGVIGSELVEDDLLDG